MSRGARRAPIFKSNDHCVLFLDCIDEATAKYDLGVLAYALMPNHFHLLVRSPESGPVLSRAMRFLLSRYAQRVNQIHDWDGPIFKGRFKSQLVARDARLIFPLAYIHLNPLKAHLVADLEAEAWTSMREYLGLDPLHRWLDVDFVFDLVGDEEFIRAMTMALLVGEEEWPDGMDQTVGWIKRVGDRAESRRRRGRKGVIRTPNLAKSSLSSTLDVVCEITGATRQELKQSRHGRGAQPERRFAVWALARATTATQGEIGRALEMSASQVGVILHRLRGKRSPKIDGWIARFEFRR